MGSQTFLDDERSVGFQMTFDRHLKTTSPFGDAPAVPWAHPCSRIGGDRQPRFTPPIIIQLPAAYPVVPWAPPQASAEQLAIEENASFTYTININMCKSL